MAVFEENSNGTFDLLVDGRTIDVEVAEDGLQDAIRRARLHGKVYVQDLNGARSLVGRR